MKKRLYALTLLVIVSTLFAQNFIGTSCRYDYFSETEVDNSTDQKVELMMRTTGAAYPIVRNQGKQIFISKFVHVDLDYNYHIENQAMEEMQAFRYEFIMLNTISPKWQFMGVIKPALASDFKGPITFRDFNCELQMGLHKTLNESLTVGGGLSYYHDNINNFPIPYVWLDWKPSKKLWLLANLPGMIDFNFKPNEHLDFSTKYDFIYERYHGKKDHYSDNEGKSINDPIIRRSGMMLSQRVNFNIKPWIQLSLEGGCGLMRKLSFYDDTKERYNLELKPNQFMSASITLGM